MDGVTRDLIISQIEAQMKTRSTSFRDATPRLEKASEDNAFLKDVLADYRRYHRHAIEEKQKQIDAAERILKHVESLDETKTKITHLGRTVRHDRGVLVQQIKAAREEMAGLIQ